MSRARWTSREVRAALARIDPQPTAVVLGLLAMDVAMFVALLAAALLVRSIPLRIPVSVALTFVGGRMFLKAHDAGHGCLARGRWLNAVLTRVLFLPTLHSASLWKHTHNQIHHVFTNLRGRDFPWVPLSPADYAARSPIGRLRYRTYRRTSGWSLYYWVELWWKRFFAPWPGSVPRRRAAYYLDTALIVAYLLAVGWAASAAAPTTVAAAESVVFALVLPLALFGWVASFVSFFHHTHPTVPWFDDVGEWKRMHDQLETAVQLGFRPRVQRILGDVMDHPVHHVQPRVGLAHIRDAQTLVQDNSHQQRWSVRVHRDIVRRCVLYDADRHQWVGYDGTPTSDRLLPVGAQRHPRTTPAGANTEHLVDLDVVGVEHVAVGAQE